MFRRYLTSCLLAAMGLVLVGVMGCSKKGVQATAETEYSEPAPAVPGSEAAGKATVVDGSDAPGIAEHQLAGRTSGGFGEGASGQDPIISSELGMPGSSVGTEGRPGPDVAQPAQEPLAGRDLGESDRGPTPVEEAVESPSPVTGGEVVVEEPLPLVDLNESIAEATPREESLASEPGREARVPPPLLSRSSSEAEQERVESLESFETIEAGHPLTEERIEGGTLIAKVEPSTVFESQVETLKQEQLAAAQEGLKDVFFAFDSWRISDEAKEALRRDAAWLEANPSGRVLVEGHCDERGTSAYNFVLGEKRAEAVRNYLIELGVNQQQVKIVSYGEERPFCSGQTEVCYQLNRRGHFTVRAR